RIAERLRACARRGWLSEEGVWMRGEKGAQPGRVRLVREIGEGGILPRLEALLHELHGPPRVLLGILRPRAPADLPGGLLHLFGVGQAEHLQVLRDAPHRTRRVWRSLGPHVARLLGRLSERRFARGGE